MKLCKTHVKLLCTGKYHPRIRFDDKTISTNGPSMRHNVSTIDNAIRYMAVLVCRSSFCNITQKDKILPSNPFIIKISTMNNIILSDVDISSE